MILYVVDNGISEKGKTTTFAVVKDLVKLDRELYNISNVKGERNCLFIAYNAPYTHRKRVYCNTAGEWEELMRILEESTEDLELELDLPPEIPTCKCDINLLMIKGCQCGGV